MSLGSAVRGTGRPLGFGAVTERPSGTTLSRSEATGIHTQAMEAAAQNLVRGACPEDCGSLCDGSLRGQEGASGGERQSGRRRGF